MVTFGSYTRKEEGRGDRRFGLLCLEDETALLASLRSESEKGRIVAAFSIREQVEKKVMQGRRNLVFTICCHRHVWRKVVTVLPDIWAIPPNHPARLTVGNIWS